VGLSLGKKWPNQGELSRRKTIVPDVQNGLSSLERVNMSAYGDRESHAQLALAEYRPLSKGQEVELLESKSEKASVFELQRKGDRKGI